MLVHNAEAATAAGEPPGEAASASGASALTAEARAMLRLLPAVGVRGRTAGYVSCPITTGAAFVRWRRGAGAGLAPGSAEWERSRRSSVIGPNIDAAAPLVQSLRRARPDLVLVDPTGLEDVDGWAQSDYHSFWVALIRRHAAVVAFADGWQFSTGCVLEFAEALGCGAQVLDAALRPLDPAAARLLVSDALEDVRTDRVLPPEPLEAALRALGDAS